MLIQISTTAAMRDSARSPTYGVGVTWFRQALRSRPWLGAWLLAATLLVRVLVPAGFMPVLAGGHVTLTLCSGTVPAPAMAAMPGMAHHDDPGHAARSPCAYADLALPALGAADPALAAVATAFAFVLAIRRAAVVSARAPGHLRPPLRGPPLAV